MLVLPSAATLAILVSLGQAACTRSPPTCASLLEHTFYNETATVVFVQTIVNGSTFVGTSANSDYNEPQLSVPQACRVGLLIQTSANSTAQAEIWLPPKSIWNERLLTVGNSGFAGAVNYPDVIWGLRKGFATVSTDTGHNSSSSDGSFLSSPEEAINWGHRALHISVAAAKEVISSYYPIHGTTGGKTLYSYYAGCSTGGRQGLNAAQRYPEDFDGVLSGSAIPWQTHTASWQIYVTLLQYPATRSSYIDASKWPGIAAAVVQQCDGLDSVVDGVIMDPSICDIDFDAMICGTGILNSTACLTEDQAANLARMYVPWLTDENGTTTGGGSDDNNLLINPGISPSGEASFSYLMNNAEPQFGPTFYRYGIYNDSVWDWNTLTAADVRVADSVNPGGANAYDPDLRPFEARGGKIVQYHGYSDPLIPSLNAPAWYDTVHKFYASIGRDDSVQNFYRLFMVPGMGHCSGGVGAWVLDGASQGGLVPPVEDAGHSMLSSLVHWVEGDFGHDSGTAAPESVIGTKYVGDVAPVVQFQRPLCRWPVVAVYDGVGEVEDAASWSCPSAGIY